jgi:hypothetical protein
MIASALIAFDPTEHPVTLASIEAHLRQSLPFVCRPTQWVGHTVTIPQVRVETPVPLTIQIDANPEYVPEELNEWADEAEESGVLPVALIALLRRATARLDIQSAEHAGERHVASDHHVVLVARTDLDPQIPEVRQVLQCLAYLVQGPVLDCVNDEWLLPHTQGPA